MGLIFGKALAGGKEGFACDGSRIRPVFARRRPPGMGVPNLRDALP